MIRQKQVVISYGPSFRCFYALA